MNQEVFDDLVSVRCEKIKQVLANKAKEYARGDRLSNFKRAAAAMSCTPAQVLAGMWMKHIISIIDLINDQANGKHADLRMWDEKITDAINYLVLLEGLLEDATCERIGS